MYIIKRNILLSLILLFIVLAAVSMFVVLPQSQFSAKASDASTVAYSRSTCSTLNSATLIYTDDVTITNITAYAKNIKVYFNIVNNGDVNYYVFGIKKSGYDEYALENVYNVPEGTTEVSYQVTGTGIFEISCYIYNADLVKIGTAVQTVKSDTDAPDVYATVNSMTEFKGLNTQFNINIDATGWSDALSGAKEVYYSFKYSDEQTNYLAYTKITGTTASLAITKNGVLTLTYIDNAGNFAQITHTYNKFDSVAPTVPVITVTPSSDTVYAGGYTKNYSVTIVYGLDTGSGIATNQYYKLDSVTTLYTGSFIISTAKNYTITASTLDKVGNKSSEATATVDGSTFDTYEPSIRNLKFSVDLTDTYPCSIRFVAVDQHSGVDYAYIEGLNVYFTKEVSDTYYATFSAIGKSGLVVHAVDKVGNDAIYHIVLNYLGDSAKSTVIEEYFTLYHSLDFSLYTASVVASIEAAYSQLSVALMADGTQNSEFDTLYSEIDDLVSGASNHSYVIESVPTYLSSSISYTVNEADLVGYQKGDNVKLVLNALTLDNEKTYVKMTSFNEGFAEAFNLTAYYKEAVLTGMANGFKIEMNLPYGYYERQFVLINKTTNEVVETTVYNNKISFTLTDSGDYVMVISGEKNSQNTTPATKTISIFGKDMSYGTFFGVVFGTLGGAVVLVVVMIFIRKKNR